MNILYCYQYGILGGVSTQLAHRLASAKSYNIDATVLFKHRVNHDGYLEDRAKVFFQNVHSSEEINPLLDTENCMFDIVSIIDSEEYFYKFCKPGRKYKVIAEVHTSMRQNMEYITRWWDKVDVILTPSEYIRTVLIDEFRIPGENIQVVANSIEVNKFSKEFIQGENLRNLKLLGPALVWVGRIDNHKNWDIAMELFSAAEKKHPGLQLIFVGGGSNGLDEKKMVFNMAESLGITDKFIWLDFIDNNDMPALYNIVKKSGGLHLITSKDESFGMTVLEASVCGCPVVAPAIPAFQEFLDFGVPLLHLYDINKREDAVRNILEVLNFNCVREKTENIQINDAIYDKYDITSSGQRYWQILLKLNNRATIGEAKNRDKLYLLVNEVAVGKSENDFWSGQISLPVGGAKSILLEGITEADCEEIYLETVFLMVSFFDNSGEKLAMRDERLGWSEKFQCIYSYIPIGKGIQPFHIELSIPNNASEICFEARHLSNVSYSIGRKISVYYKKEINPLMCEKKENAKNEYRVACILDEFSFFSWQHQFDLVNLSYDNCMEEIKVFNPQFLLVESAWQGKNGEWKAYIAKAKRSDFQFERIFQVLDLCKKLGIPTVFWNKEDPYHFENFIELAQEFDYIATIDQDMVPFYQQKTKKKNAFYLPFAAETKLHNPAKNTASFLGEVAFSGTWYGEYKERSEKMQYLLRAAKQHSLWIFDRNFGTGQLVWSYPEEFRNEVVGRVDYKEMAYLYRFFKTFLNVDTVAESQWVCSRRVYEILASGVPIISAHASGIDALFSKPIVYTVDNQEETKQALNFFLNDEDKHNRISHLAYRTIHSQHTYYHRAKQILAKLNIDRSACRQCSVGAIIVATSKKELEMHLASCERQRYPLSSIRVICPKYLERTVEQDEKLKENKFFTYTEQYGFGNLLIRIAGQMEEEYIAIMQGKVIFGVEYLADMILAGQFTQADIIGKGSFYFYNELTNEAELINEDRRHQYTWQLTNHALVIRREGLETLKVTLGHTGMEIEKILLAAYRENFSAYSADPYNCMVMSSLMDFSKMLSKSEVFF